MWLFGKLTRFFFRLHIRYELQPYARVIGAHRDEVLQVTTKECAKLFEDTWVYGTR